MHILQKRTLLLLFVLIITHIATNGQTPHEKILQLVQDYDIQKLNRVYPLLEDSLDDFTRHAISGYVFYGMNCLEQAFESHDYIIKKYSSVGDLTDYLYLAVNELNSLGEYKKAKQYVEQFYYNDTLLQNTKILFPKEHLMVNPYSVAYALQNKEPSRVLRISNKPTVVNMDMTKNGYWSITGIIKGKSTDFLIDTGSSYNIVTEDFARNNDITLFDDSIEIQGVTGSVMARLGFVDSIYIGNISYQNVWVAILPSIVSNFEDFLGVKINAILGIPFLRTAGVVEIYPKKKKIIFPIIDANAKPDAGSNMSVLEYIRIEMSVGPINRMLTILDSGSNNIIIKKDLYDTYKEDFEKYDFEKSRIGFVGLSETIDTIHVWNANKKIPLKIGETRIRSKATTVMEAQDKAGAFPLVGVCILNKFKKITIDFNSMKFITNN